MSSSALVAMLMAATVATAAEVTPVWGVLVAEGNQRRGHREDVARSTQFLGPCTSECQAFPSRAERDYFGRVRDFFPFSRSLPSHTIGGRDGCFATGCSGAGKGARTPSHRRRIRWD